jgi:hypothetical protein
MSVPVAVDIEKKAWLADLVDETLASYDPAAAILRLPPELRGADPDGPGLEARARTLLVRSLRRPEGHLPQGESEQEAFLGPVHSDVGLALDIALVHGAPFERDRWRAELAAVFAALAGAVDLARAADPGRVSGGQPAAVRKALVKAGAVLKARGFPAGDPKEGLPLRAGLLTLERRHLARLAIAFHGAGQLDVAAARKLHEAGAGDAVLLVEALAGVAAAPAPLEAPRRRAALLQVARLGLARDPARKARAAVLAPRAPAELARAAPVRLRAFLLEQLLLSELASAQTAPARAAYVQAFVEESRIPPEQVAALQADAADLYAGQQRWLEPAPAGAPDEWETLADAWENAADDIMEKVAVAVTENLEAIVTEVKETGELGTLLAKAASGRKLSADEKRKVKKQLIDLAKAVPALAIFAAPGGMLLLPLLAKLLPFNVLPSAWEAKTDKAKPVSKKAGG